MTKAIRIHANGGPEVMKWEDVPTPEPGPGEALIKHHAVGLNYIDVYFRTGLYKAPNMPLIIGQEGAGTVTARRRRRHWCSRATASPMPDRSAAMPPTACCRRSAGQTAGCDQLRDRRGDDAAGHDRAIPVRRTYPVKAGDTIVVHAAAGGVGLILCQWAKHLGATVIGVVSSRGEGGAGARAWRRSYRGRLRQPGRRGEEASPAAPWCPVVYDSVGKDTLTASLDCLAPLGLMVSYGNASGPVPPFDLGRTGRQGQPVSDPADAADLHRETRGPGGGGGRSVRRWSDGCGEDPGQPDLPAAGCGEGAYRAGGAARPPAARCSIP